MLSLVIHLADAGDNGLLVEGAYERGARIYERCAACHALGMDRTGPRHCGLVGRRAGSIMGFPYSPAMRKSKIVWTEANLNRFLKSPLTIVPGTSMGYDGIKDDGERRDLIAYLREAARGSECQIHVPGTRQLH
ncbi:c-type cytochrome [Denitratisoma oestradiolicum]|nr:c-type cytochrome [Denitratisoma oestradiolicum]